MSKKESEELRLLRETVEALQARVAGLEARVAGLESRTLGLATFGPGLYGASVTTQPPAWGDVEYPPPKRRPAVTYLSDVTPDFDPDDYPLF